MQVPAADFIESALDALEKRSDKFIEDEMRELHEAVGERSKDYAMGYALGLETARAIVAGNVAVITHGIDPQEIL